MSGTEPAVPVVVLPAALRPVIDVLEVLAAPGIPTIAVIGGMGVNIRLSTSTATHRATQDIDVVADNDSPTALEILSRHRTVTRDHTVVVNGLDVDIIDTEKLTEADLEGIDDGPKLFVAGHRWALETAAPVRITTVPGNRPPTELRTATPGGLVAAKSHAAGYPSSARRAAKHGGDLYDLYRLIEAFDSQGELRTQLNSAPGGLGRLIAAVVQTEILANPARAMRQMAAVSATELTTAQIIDVTEPFLAGLE